MLEPRIGAETDEIDNIERRAAMALATNLGQIGVEVLGRTGVERRRRADRSGSALRNDRRRRRGDEHRSRHDRQRQLGFQLTREIGVSGKGTSPKAMRP